MARHLPHNYSITNTKYGIHMNHNTDQCQDFSAAAASTSTISTVRSTEKVVFWHDGAEVGTLDWSQGQVCFQGDVDLSADQLATVVNGRVLDINQEQRTEIQQTRAWLAHVIGLLNKEQFEDTDVQAALDYLHQHEFFENRIRGL